MNFSHQAIAAHTAQANLSLPTSPALTATPPHSPITITSPSNSPDRPSANTSTNTPSTLNPITATYLGVRSPLTAITNILNAAPMGALSPAQVCKPSLKPLPALPLPEPLLEPNPDRFVLFPITDPQTWNFYKKAEASFWTAEEIDLRNDFADFEKLTPNERHFVTRALAFFAAADGVVNENLAQNFACEIQSPEARCFYGLQIAMENTHSETCSLLIDSHMRDEAEKELLFKSAQRIPSIRAKAEWALAFTHRDHATFAERCVAFAAVEGIFFSGSFCAIFWLKKRGLLPGLCFSNDLISRDEGVHCDFACLIYSRLKNKPSRERVCEIIRAAVRIEHDFVCGSLPVDLIGMNTSLMSDYVEFCADRLLVALGLPRWHNTCNPFEWMEMISLQGKSNFFERRASECAKSGVAAQPTDRNFTLDADF